MAPWTGHQVKAELIQMLGQCKCPTSHAWFWTLENPERTSIDSHDATVTRSVVPNLNVFMKLAIERAKHGEERPLGFG